jgi:glucose/mannose transport system substrate-binding protein
MRSSGNLFRGARAFAMVLAVAVSACSEGGSTGSVEILDWWKQGGEAQAIGALLDLFKQRNPSVKIVDSSVDGSALARAAIRTKISDGNPPDTFQANGGWDLMAWVLYNGHDAGQTQLQALDAAALDLGNVPAPVLDTVSYKDRDADKDKVYAVPLNIHRVNTFFYNTQVFEDVGLQVEDLTTLDKLFEAAEAIKAYNARSGRAPITPFAMGFRQTEGDMASDDTWTLALLFFENILVAQLGPTQYEQLFRDPHPGDAQTEQDMAMALENFRRLVSYSNLNASALTWNEPLDMVLRGDAAMTIMGDWGTGYLKSIEGSEGKFGVVPTPGTAGTFVFTTDTFGLTVGAKNPRDTLELLKLFASREGQDRFNPIKGSISARTDSDIENGQYDELAKQTFADFQHAIQVPATSILAPQMYLDAIGAALADFAKARENGNPSIVQHTLDNYADVLLASCWPAPAPNCH